MIIPTQIVLGGFLLFPVVLAGLWRLLRAPAARPWRPVASAYLVVLVLLFATSGKGYYALGFLPALFAAEAIPLAGWLSRGHVVLRRVVFAVAASVSLAFVATLTLPVLPAETLAASPFPDTWRVHRTDRLASGRHRGRCGAGLVADEQANAS